MGGRYKWFGHAAIPPTHAFFLAFDIILDIFYT